MNLRFLSLSNPRQFRINVVFGLCACVCVRLGASIAIKSILKYALFMAWLWAIDFETCLDQHFRFGNNNKNSHKSQPFLPKVHYQAQFEKCWYLHLRTSSFWRMCALFVFFEWIELKAEKPDNTVNYIWIAHDSNVSTLFGSLQHIISIGILDDDVGGGGVVVVYVVDFHWFSCHRSIFLNLFALAFVYLAQVKVCCNTYNTNTHTAIRRTYGYIT